MLRTTNFVITKWNPLIKAEQSPVADLQSFQLDQYSVPPTDKYEIKRSAPYMSPSGIYEGAWAKPSVDKLSDAYPVKYFWVLAEGETDFWIELMEGDRFRRKKVERWHVGSPQDDLLKDFTGTLYCSVERSNWVMVCEYVCGKTFFNRNITLHLNSNIVFQSHHEKVAEQVRAMLRKKGYYEFDDIFR